MVLFGAGRWGGCLSADRLRTLAKTDYNLILEDDKHDYLDGMSRNTIRINFVQNPDSMLKEGIKRLYNAFVEVKNVRPA
jgi:DNA-binding transcriptional MocR family regulator